MIVLSGHGKPGCATARKPQVKEIREGTTTDVKAESRKEWLEGLSRAYSWAVELNDNLSHLFIDLEQAEKLWNDEWPPSLLQIYWATWLIKIPSVSTAGNKLKPSTVEQAIGLAESIA